MLPYLAESVGRENYQQELYAVPGLSLTTLARLYWKITIKLILS